MRADVFRALADPVRRGLLDSLRERNGQTLKELSASRAMSRQAVSKHLAVLEESDLVVAVVRGREKWHYLNAAAITEIAKRWISTFDEAPLAAIFDLKRTLEEPGMSRPSFAYTLYIRAPIGEVWRALTESEFTTRWWHATALSSTWIVGDRVIWSVRGVSIDEPGQVVEEYEPPHRLAYRWHALTDEWQAAVQLDEASFNAGRMERLSKVTFELEEVVGEGKVRLTVVHDDFDEGSVLATKVSHGWPDVLSDLKTLLETGSI
jgi:uncharacterized protein YndB with AHSA1/START domain